MKSEGKTKVIIRYREDAGVRVTIERDGQSIDLDNVLGVDVKRKGRLILELDNIEYHGEGAGLRFGNGKKPRPLTRGPLPTVGDIVGDSKA